MRVIEVAVVSVVILLILIFGVVMVEKILRSGSSVAMFRQTVYAYGMFTFTELQVQGKTDISKYLGGIPTTTVEVDNAKRTIPTALRFFGVLISDLPKSTQWDGINVGSAYYGFEDYGGKSEKPLNAMWINYINLMKVVSEDFTTMVYGNGTIYDLMSGNSYTVTIFPTFSKKTYSEMEDFFTRAFGVYTITNKHKTYVVRRYLIPQTLYYYPDDSKLGIGYISDNGFGAPTSTLFSILRSAYPFNTINTEEQFYYIPNNNPANIIVVTSKLHANITLSGFVSPDGSLTNGSTVEIDGKGYSIVTDAMSIFKFRGGTTGEFTVKGYFGEIEIKKPETGGERYNLEQKATVVAIAPAISPDYINIEPLVLHFKAVSVKIRTHKEHLIFTVKDGEEYTIADFKFEEK